MDFQNFGSGLFSDDSTSCQTPESTKNPFSPTRFSYELRKPVTSWRKYSSVDI